MFIFIDKFDTKLMDKDIISLKLLNLLVEICKKRQNLSYIISSYSCNMKLWLKIH